MRDKMYLYVLKFQEGDRIKIGRSINIDQRLTAFGGPSQFNLNDSYIVEGTGPHIIKLEGQLHRDFEPFKREHTGLSSGNEEVFDISCLPEVIDEIEHKIQKFPHFGFALSKGVSFAPLRPHASRIEKYKAPSHKTPANGIHIHWAEGINAEEATDLLLSAIKSHPQPHHGEYILQTDQPELLKKLFNSNITGSYQKQDGKYVNILADRIVTNLSYSVIDGEGKISAAFVAKSILEGKLDPSYWPIEKYAEVHKNKKTGEWTSKIIEESPPLIR